HTRPCLSLSSLSLHDALPISKRIIDPDLAVFISGHDNKMTVLGKISRPHAADHRMTGRKLCRQLLLCQKTTVTGQPKVRSGLLQDRKSTRLNSSHVSISYAVF